MRSNVDLLVVGGGPAGAALAALASRTGARVLLVERARFPRDKVCGEFVSAEGCEVLQRLGVLGELISVGAPRIDSCRISGRRGNRVDAPLPHPPGRGAPGMGISREVMDAVLLEYAGRCGVEVLQRHEAVAPVIEGSRVRGVRVRRVGHATPGEQLRASLVVAADGRRSMFVRALHPGLGDPRRSGPGSWFGLKAHLDAAPSRLDGRVELHLFDGGYAGLAAVEGRRINLCLLTTVRSLRACGGSADRLFVERISSRRAVRESLGDARPCSRWKSVGPLRFAVRKPASRGVLFVGDAAGTIDPFSGEGMSNALRGAEIALPFVLQAIARGGLTEESGRAYALRWRRAFGPVTRRARRLGRLFERPRLAGPLLSLLGGTARGMLPRLVAATRSGWEA